MIRYTSSLVLLGAIIGSALAQKSILVGFSCDAGLEAVLKRANPPPDDGVAAFGSMGAREDPTITMFHSPRRNRKAKGGSRRKLGIFDSNVNTTGPVEPDESETEMTLGFLKVDFTDADGLPIYTNHTDIEKEINDLKLLPCVTIVEQDGEVKALDFSTNVKEGKKVKRSSLRGQMERVLAEEVTWGIEMVNMNPIEKTPKKKVKVCIIDTGYALGHEDLPKESDGVTGFTPPDKDASFGVWNEDEHSHGTHVAGTVGAIGSNNKGVVGVLPNPSWFTFHIGKGLGDTGTGSNSGIAQCIIDCVSSGADVISMSLGGPDYSSVVNAACEDAYDAGVLVVAAAGNSGSENYNYPASYPVVMSVASVQYGSGPNGNSYGLLSSFSTINGGNEIAAPGSSVKSTVPGNKYEFFSGTSMATPHVAGVAAWLRAHFPECEPNQIRNAMLISCREPPRASDDWDKQYGHGIVDAGAAYSLLFSDGCVGAGGLSSSDALGPDKDPSEMAQGGAYQKDIGCTQDKHCYIGSSFGPRFCDTDTHRCTTSPCVGADVKITVEFMTDDWPTESTWTLSQTCGSGFSMSSPVYNEKNKLHIQNYCTSNGEFVFTMNDSFGDGLSEGGYYKVYRDDVEMISELGVNFGRSTTESFGSCGAPPPTPPPVTNMPTVGSEITSQRTLVCGNPGKCEGGDVTTVSKTANRGVRCCRDESHEQGDWPARCSSMSNIWGQSFMDNIPDDITATGNGCVKETDFAGAMETCQANNARLCTPAEMLDRCTKGTGCQLNSVHVWVAIASGDACSTDAECASGNCTGDLCL